MPTLAELRAQQAAAPRQGGSNAEYIRFTQEGETRYLRFMFDTPEHIEVHRKFFNNTTKQWEIDGDQGSYRIVFDCIEYKPDGSDAHRVKWEVSQYLYDEYLQPYVEKSLPASQRVWEVKVRRPGTTEVSYVAFPVDGDTTKFPIIDRPAKPAAGAPTPGVTSVPRAANSPVAPATRPAPAPAPVANETPDIPFDPDPAPEVAPQPAAPKKSKYF